MKYHVLARGSPDHPDLDYETDDVPTDLTWKYPFVQVAVLEAISYSAIMAALEAQET